MSSVCFSPCTGYPFTCDVPVGDRIYQVYVEDRKDLGGGTPKSVDLVVKQRPPVCGLAVPGTVDDLKRAPHDKK